MRILVLMLAAALNVGAAQLLSDSSFEVPAYTAGTAPMHMVSATIGSWTVVGPAGQDIATLVYPYTSTYVFNAQDGAQSLDLTGYSNSGLAKGVAQTAATTVGTSYQVSFWLGNLGGPNSQSPLASQVDLYVGGANVGTFTNSSRAFEVTGAEIVNWAQFTYSFTATSSSTEIRILGTIPIGDFYNGLDNVTLTDINVDGRIPEPSTLVMCSAGLVLLLFGRRRRRV